MAEQKDKKVDYVVAEFTRYEQAISDKFAKAEAWYKSWKCTPPARNYDWQNQVSVPVMVEAEQTISPRLFTALFPTDAPVDVIVEGQADPQQGIKIKYLLQNYFRKASVQGQFARMLPQCTVFGTAYAEGGNWLVKRGWMTDDKGNRYNAIIESRPDMQFVDFFELYPHPAKLTMDDGLPIIRKRYCDSEYLKSLAENPFFKMEGIEKALKTDPPKSNAKKGEKYEILEYWGPYNHEFEKDGRLLEEKALPYWIIVINRKVKIRGIPNPYNHQMPPYIKIKLYEDPKPSWFGIGIGSIGKSTQDRLEKIVNQRLDNVDLVINRQGIYNANDPKVSKKSLETSKPGKWHPASDTITSIRWMDIPDVTQSSYKEEEIAKADFREATGAASPMIPTDEQHRTAMGISLLQGAAGTRFRPVLRIMEMEGVEALARLFFANARQFMTRNEWVIATIEGVPSPIEVKPEDIQAKVHFIPTGVSEMMNKEVQIGQLLRYKEVTMTDPTVNRREINKRIAELFGFKDIDKLLVPISQSPGGKGGGGLSPQESDIVRQRMTEGASPEQIKQEMLGPPPAEEGGGISGI